MKVTPIAHTLIDWDALAEVAGETKFFVEAENELEEAGDIDHLAEFAGRACYKAFERKNPATATTETYLDDILDKGHFSIFEHGTVTFHVKDVSRSLLLELERHRFLSFSVESQRYVDQARSHPSPVAPPIFDLEPSLWIALQTHYGASLDLYDQTFTKLREHGASMKAARSAARAFLPNATPVDFVVSGNIRAWRDVLEKRLDPGADDEIRTFAGNILKELRVIAPLSVQDFQDSSI